MTFADEAEFEGANFSGTATFEGTTFNSVIFRRAIFFDWAYFYGATFSTYAGFEGTTFRSKTSFINVEMNASASLEAAIFESEPPKFFGAKLHQDTVWRGITWPPKPKDKKEAGHFIDAYACLKLEMDRLKKHEDELDFFALELQSRRVLLGPWAGLPIAIYGAFSD